MHAEEKSPVALLNALEMTQELLTACLPELVEGVAVIPSDVLRKSAETIYEIDKHVRDIRENIIKHRAIHALRALGGSTAEDPDDAKPWVNDSWIAECEEAGVYSRQPQVFRYVEEPILAATLTRTELWMLAQRHLNTVVNNNESAAWTGECEKLDGLRAKVHEQRFWQLFEQLSPEDQKRFEQQIEIRKRYLKSIKNEVRRIANEEEAFQKRVEAGLASDAEIAAHETHPLIIGSPVVPAPADGGPQPENWNMYATGYHENPFPDHFLPD